jgi:hypothetical protein
MLSETGKINPQIYCNAQRAAFIVTGAQFYNYCINAGICYFQKIDVKKSFFVDLIEFKS